MANKRVLVTGGRWFNATDQVHLVLAPLHARFGIEELGEGGATGADELSKLWALAHNIPVRTFEANWKLFGNRAGSIRNSEMLREFKPNLGISFPGGKGTADMTAKLLAAGVPTLVGIWKNDAEQEVIWKMKHG